MRDLQGSSEDQWVEALQDKFSVQMENFLVLSMHFNPILLGTPWALAGTGDGTGLDEDKVPALTELL